MLVFMTKIRQNIDNKFDLDKLDLYQEGLTTIPIGSTRSVKLRRGSAIHPTSDEDIVYSIWKHMAVHKRTGRA